jgi:hypothetical protein
VGGVYFMLLSTRMRRACLIFLGNWQYKEEGGYRFIEAAKNKGLPRTAVQAIVVRIQADPARAGELIKKIDWERLKKLIKN